MTINKNITPAFILLLLFVSLITGCKKNNEKEITISVVTYNVAGLPEGISSSHPAQYTSSISPLLNEFDLVHMQEDFCYHDSILLYNTHPYRTETLGCVPTGDGLNALSKFPILNVVRFAWTNCTNPDCFTPKGFYYSQIDLGDIGKVDFYDIHCNAGGSDASMAARRGNIAKISSYIAEHSTGNPVVVMGDFNSRYTRDGDSIRAFFDLGFKDVWLELIRGGSIPAISPDKLDSCEPVHTSPDCEGVDKLFYRSNNQVEITPLSYQVDDNRFYYQGNDTLMLSDHWPVFVKFNIRKK